MIQGFGEHFDHIFEIYDQKMEGYWEKFESHHARP